MRLAALLLCAVSVAARADDSSTWKGVWTGTIGSMPVTACLDEHDGHWQGSYYYLRHLQTIRIEATGNAPDGQLVLAEEKPPGSRAAPAWRLSSPGDGKLQGTWKGSGKPLPVSLKLAPVAEDDQDEAPCRGRAFNSALETKGRIAFHPGQPGNAGFSVMRMEMGTQHAGAELTSLQLSGNSAAIVRVNTQLRSSLMAEQSIMPLS